MSAIEDDKAASDRHSRSSSCTGGYCPGVYHVAVKWNVLVHFSSSEKPSSCHVLSTNVT